MKVYPTPGLQVRDPVTKQLLPAEGVDALEGNLFYVRRLRDGDMTLTPPASVIAAKVGSIIGDKA